jgi:hypothetical protein
VAELASRWTRLSAQVNQQMAAEPAAAAAAPVPAAFLRRSAQVDLSGRFGIGGLGPQPPPSPINLPPSAPSPINLPPSQADSASTEPVPAAAPPSADLDAAAADPDAAAAEPVAAADADAAAAEPDAAAAEQVAAKAAAWVEMAADRQLYLANCGDRESLLALALEDVRKADSSLQLAATLYDEIAESMSDSASASTSTPASDIASACFRRMAASRACASALASLAGDVAAASACASAPSIAAPAPAAPASIASAPASASACASTPATRPIPKRPKYTYAEYVWPDTYAELRDQRFETDFLWYSCPMKGCNFTTLEAFSLLQHIAQNSEHAPKHVADAYWHQCHGSSS